MRSVPRFLIELLTTTFRESRNVHGFTISNLSASSTDRTLADLSAIVGEEIPRWRLTRYPRFVDE